MENRLITSFADYRNAASDLLARARHQILIDDHDLSALQLESPAARAALAGFLQQAGSHLRIALCDSRPLQIDHPRLALLLQTHSQQVDVREFSAPPRPEESLLLIDGEHALIRFTPEQIRSKLLLADSTAVAPYAQRFAQRWQENGFPVSFRPLGL